MEEKLLKIAELYFTGDKELSTAWLTQLIGEENAEANIFVMECYKDMDNDAEIILERFTFAKMKFSTYKIGFGRNYRYEVTFDIAFKGNGITTSKDFSRYQVGNGEPKDYLLSLVCNCLRSSGYELHNALFIGTSKYFIANN